MPKPLIAIAFRRSRLALAAQLAVSASLALYAAIFVGGASAVVVGILGVVFGAWQWHREPRVFHLRCRLENDREWWERCDTGTHWHAVSCRPLRVGPWLSALSIDGRTTWLWPDSADAESRRHLREYLQLGLTGAASRG